VALGGTIPVGAMPASRPKPPTQLVAKGNASGLSLTWHHGNSVTGYIVEQATNRRFTRSLHTYRTHGIQKVFTPSAVTTGVTYYFRVAAKRGSSRSRWSTAAVATDRTRFSPIRVLSYNSRSAKFDGERAPGGVVAPFSQRRPGQLTLLRSSHAAVIGIQEGAFCLQKHHGAPCTRQIDSLAAGLPGYVLDDTSRTSGGGGIDRYTADDILYAPSVLSTVGRGGHFLIGPSGALQRFAAFQIFRVNATGAKFLFIVTHTVASGTDQQRGEETASMLKQGRAYAAAHGVTSVVYSGDFNSYVGEYHVHDYSGTIMRNANVPDSIEEAAHYSKAKYDSINAYYRIPKQGHGSSDHIYATRGIGVIRWGELLQLSGGKFVGVIPSDHNPIYADLQLPY
jgi:hypothetical protein